MKNREYPHKENREQRRADTPVCPYKTREIYTISAKETLKTLKSLETLRTSTLPTTGAGSALTYKHKRWRPCGRHLIANSVSPVWAGCPAPTSVSIFHQSFNKYLLAILDVDTLLGLVHTTTAEVKDHTLYIHIHWNIVDSCNTVILLTNYT